MKKMDKATKGTLGFVFIACVAFGGFLGAFAVLAWAAENGLLLPDILFLIIWACASGAIGYPLYLWWQKQ